MQPNLKPLRCSYKLKGALACFGCGHTPHAAHRDCPAANDTCHRCGKRGHWQQVCSAFTANTVTQAIDTDFEASTAHVITHDAAQAQSASRGIFVHLGLSLQHQLIVSASRWILDGHATPYMLLI